MRANPVFRRIIPYLNYRIKEFINQCYRFLILLAAVLCFYSGCDHIITDPRNDTKWVYKIPIHITGSAGSTAICADNAIVVVDKEIIIQTDEYGKAIIDSLTVGEHTFNIEHPAYGTYSFNRTISDDAEIHIEILSAEDYFPLALGNTWTYEYNYYNGGPAIYWQYTKIEGTLTWEIVSVDTSEGSIAYSIHEIMNGARERRVYYVDDQSDSIFFDSTSSDQVITLIEHENHRLTGGEGSLVTGLSAINKSTLLRYYNPDIATDSVRVGTDPNLLRIWMRRGVGLTEIYSKTGSHHVTSSMAILTGYSFSE